MARSKLDFGVGEGLYLIPSDMNLHDMSGGLNGYNNQLKIATSSLGLGLNTTVNVDRVQKYAAPTPAPTPALTPTPKPTPTPATKPTLAPKENTALDDHDELKAAILVGAVAGFVAFKCYSA
jgi:hypothetical protein